MRDGRYTYRVSDAAGRAFAMLIFLFIFFGVAYHIVHWWTVEPTSCSEAIATCHNTSGWRCDYVDQRCKGLAP